MSDENEKVVVLNSFLNVKAIEPFPIKSVEPIKIDSLPDVNIASLPKYHYIMYGNGENTYLLENQTANGALLNHSQALIKLLNSGYEIHFYGKLFESEGNSNPVLILRCPI